MDFEEKQKRQMIRVIIAEVGMVLAVVAIVVVSLMAAMGFMISGNGSIEQTGLLQLHTLPTGASVKIDGATVFGRTNLSRTLSAGEHNLEIYRDGYDTWRNTIKVESGMLVRLYYPRLFLLSRSAERVKVLSEDGELDFFQPSPRKNFAVMAVKGAAEWQIADLRSDEVKLSTLDLSSVLPGMVKAETRKVTASSGAYAHGAMSGYKFVGEVDEVRWSDNEENLLVKVTYENRSEWVLVRLKDLAHSVNLSRAFGLSNEAQMEYIDSTASQLYVLEKRQLRRINTSSNVMSRILVDNVIDFMNDESKVIYLTGTVDGKNRAIGVFRDDENGGTILAKVADDAKVQIALANYYDEDYMMWTEGQNLNIWYGRLPSYSEAGVRAEELKVLFEAVELEHEPEKLQVSPGGEYLLARSGKNSMIVDLYNGELCQYETLTEQIAWFDDSMMYAVVDNRIAVWDFDGMNWRDLSKDVKLKGENVAVKVESDSPVVVSANNRYIYYLTKKSDKDGKVLTYLTREQIRD